MKKWIVILFFVLALFVAVSFIAVTKPSITSVEAAKIKSDWQTDTADAARQYSVPQLRLLAMIGNESRGDVTTIGAAGEVGLMQLTQGALDDINARFGSTFTQENIRDGRLNIFAGAAYLRMMLDKFNGDIAKATRAYNAGAKAVSWNPLAGAFYLAKVEANEKILT